jgi:hypothetical protein
MRKGRRPVRSAPVGRSAGKPKLIPASQALQFDITVAAISTTTSTEEVDLVKAALLYGDRVVLLSPGTEAVLGGAALAELSPSEQLEAFAPILRGISAETSDAILAISRKRRRTPAEVAVLGSFQSMLRPLIQEQWLPALEGLADDTGMSELFPAMEAGLVVMKPIMLNEADDTMDRLVQEVVGLLSDPNAYPLFDRTVGAVASAGVREGLFALHDRTSRHGKQVGLAEGLLGLLPTFPHGTVDQILELREDIRLPRIRFREAVASLSRDFTSESFDEDFESEVRDAWIERVAPALALIEEAIRDSRVTRSITRTLTTNEAAAGGVLGVAATAAADPGNLLSVVGGLNAGTLAGGTAKALWDGVAKRREAQQNGFYLLHQTNEALARSA